MLALLLLSAVSFSAADYQGDSEKHPEDSEGSQVDTVAQNDQDKDDQCASWAFYGECTTNTEYMKRMCPVSCAPFFKNMGTQEGGGADDKPKPAGHVEDDIEADDDGVVAGDEDDFQRLLEEASQDEASNGEGEAAGELPQERTQSVEEGHPNPDPAAEVPHKRDVPNGGKGRPPKRPVLPANDMMVKYRQLEQDLSSTKASLDITTAALKAKERELGEASAETIDMRAARVELQRKVETVEGERARSDEEIAKLKTELEQAYRAANEASAKAAQQPAPSPSGLQDLLHSDWREIVVSLHSLGVAFADYLPTLAAEVTESMLRLFRADPPLNIISMVFAFLMVILVVFRALPGCKSDGNVNAAAMAAAAAAAAASAQPAPQMAVPQAKGGNTDAIVQNLQAQVEGLAQLQEQTASELRQATTNSAQCVSKLSAELQVFQRERVLIDEEMLLATKEILEWLGNSVGGVSHSSEQVMSSRGREVEPEPAPAPVNGVGSAWPPKEQAIAALASPTCSEYAGLSLSSLAVSPTTSPAAAASLVASAPLGSCSDTGTATPMRPSPSPSPSSSHSPAAPARKQLGAPAAAQPPQPPQVEAQPPALAPPPEAPAPAPVVADASSGRPLVSPRAPSPEPAEEAKQPHAEPPAPELAAAPVPAPAPAQLSPAAEELAQASPAATQASPPPMQIPQSAPALPEPTSSPAAPPAPTASAPTAPAPPAPAPTPAEEPAAPPSSEQASPPPPMPSQQDSEGPPARTLGPPGMAMGGPGGPPGFAARRPSPGPAGGPAAGGRPQQQEIKGSSNPFGSRPQPKEIAAATGPFGARPKQQPIQAAGNPFGSRPQPKEISAASNPFGGR
eukprot:TRINITY_DN18311_c0_g1_i1.p1 TRINITY_DN18311_c0_g1~~TRINITY_DN18311_c0_g1_i1.p1  ORF type:complete len:881 (+),score=189.75 TRINITY_DN18311_c0_g1_i1:89-2644(+)